jgi:hypothetical protein
LAAIWLALLGAQARAATLSSADANAWQDLAHRSSEIAEDLAGAAQVALTQTPAAQDLREYQCLDALRVDAEKTASEVIDIAVLTYLDSEMLDSRDEVLTTHSLRPLVDGSINVLAVVRSHVGATGEQCAWSPLVSAKAGALGDFLDQTTPGLQDLQTALANATDPSPPVARRRRR